MAVQLWPLGLAPRLGEGAGRIRHQAKDFCRGLILGATGLPGREWETAAQRTGPRKKVRVLDARDPEPPRKAEGQDQCPLSGRPGVRARV